MFQLRLCYSNTLFNMLCTIRNIENIYHTAYTELVKSINGDLKTLRLSHGTEVRTAVISLQGCFYEGILSGHDNQASISVSDRHFKRHFALKRGFRSEMDFSRTVASATNRTADRLLTSATRTDQLRGKYDKMARILRMKRCFV